MVLEGIMWAPHQVLENLFIGGQLAAKREDVLKSIGVTNIVVVGAELQICFPEHFAYLQIKALDLPNYPLLPHFQSTNQYIEEVLSKGGCVLVHCYQGVSRSSTILCAYLMYKLQLPAVKALHLLQQKHTQAGPNFGFRYQLGQYEAILRGEAPVPALIVGRDDHVNCTCRLF